MELVTGGGIVTAENLQTAVYIGYMEIASLMVVAGIILAVGFWQVCLK